MREFSILRRSGAVVLGLAMTTFACSSSSNNATQRVAIDANAFCNEFVTTCGDTSLGNGSVSDCVNTVSILRFTQACADLVAGATCYELTSASSTFENTCFPSCTSPGTVFCNSDNTLSECTATGVSADGGTNASSANSFTVDCAAGCQQRGMTYSGTCGTTYDGQTSSQQECWCK